MTTNDLTGWMLDEHARATALADRLRAKVAAAPAADRAGWIGELQACFDEYADHMARHLAREEEGGYLEHVLELRPSLAQAVEIIRNEHDELTQIFGNVRNAVHELQPTDVLLLRDCCKRIENLLGWIERHEEHENHLVIYAFSQELGAQD